MSSSSTAKKKEEIRKHFLQVFQRQPRDEREVAMFVLASMLYGGSYMQLFSTCVQHADFILETMTDDPDAFKKEKQALTGHDLICDRTTLFTGAMGMLLDFMNMSKMQQEVDAALESAMKLEAK